MLIDLSPPDLPAEAVRDLASQLRLPGPYVDEPEGAARLSRCLAAALVVVEARTARRLLARRFEFRLGVWPNAGCVTLPAAPVQSIEAVGVRDAAGTETLVALDGFRIDGFGPALVVEARASTQLPKVQTDETGFVRFVGGYGPNWSDVPADLRLATTLVAAAMHDSGAGDPAQVQMPFGALALLEPYRRVRL